LAVIFFSPASFSRAVVRLGILQAPPDQVDVALWCLAASLRFLPESVQNIDGRLQTHRVNGPTGVSVEIIDQFYRAATQSLEQLRRGRMLAGLRKE
jgi:hypothetical protein